MSAAAARHGRRQAVAVRVTPGILAGGHEKIATGHERLQVRPGARGGGARVPRGARGSAARLARTARASRLAGGRPGCARGRRALVPGVLRRPCAGAAADRRRRRSRHSLRLRVRARCACLGCGRRGGGATPLPGGEAADRAGTLGRGPGRRDALPRTHPQDGGRRDALGGARRRHGRQPAPRTLRRPLHGRRGGSPRASR